MVVERNAMAILEGFLGHATYVSRFSSHRFLSSWMSLVGFRSTSLSKTSRLVASSSVFRHFLSTSEPPDSFTPTGAHSSCHRNSKTSATKMELQLQNYALLSSMHRPKRTLKRNCAEGRSVPVTLRKSPIL